VRIASGNSQGNLSDFELVQSTKVAGLPKVGRFPLSVWYDKTVNQQEQEYLSKVKDVITQHNKLIEMINKLAAINSSNTDGFSLNTLALIDYFKELKFEGDNDNLGGGPDDDDWDAKDQEEASGIVESVKRVLSDIENANWYSQVFTAELAYSRLKDGDYAYRITKQPMDAATTKEAKKQTEDLRHAAPKAYPKEPMFTLEDVRLRTELVDSNGSPVKLRST